jgi:oxaloacetate decarboxylase alpha subunit/acetyl-CoA carboxylase biotin carboxyl carrier protein
MNRKKYNPPVGDTEPEQPYSAQGGQSDSVISIEQLQRLVRLLDQSSVSELELKHIEKGTCLVLRKASATENTESRNGALPAIQLITPAATEEPDSASVEAEADHKIVSHQVGTFHVWARPRGGALVAVGDRVKEGQLVGTIESLNVFNEVESPVAGRVVEIFVQEGQPVEYGQLLMTVASFTGE